MSLTVGELVAYASVDDDDFDRGIDNIGRQLTRAAREADKTFGGIPTTARKSGEETGEQFVRGADGKLRDSRGRFVSEGKKAGEGFALGFGGGIGGAAGKVGKLLVGATVQASALATKVGAIGLAAGGLFAAAKGAAAFVGALAPAAGIVAGLPAAFLLAKAAAGTLQVALLGVGDAMGAALGEDAKKFEESLKELSPAAQSVARELRALKPEIDGLKSSVQDAFFAPLAGQLTAVAAVLMGPLRTGMSGLSAEFGRLASGVAQFGQSTPAVDLVKAAFASLKAEVASISADSVKGLLQSIADFTRSTLPAFDGLGAGLDGLIQRFSTWLDAATAAGKPMEWINQALDVLGQLGGVLSSIGGIVQSVFGAMTTAGGGALGVVGQLLDKVNDFLSSAEGQDVLVTIFESLAEVGEALWPVLQAVAEAAGMLAPHIAEVATSLGPALVSAVQALGPALAAALPGLTAIADALAQAFKDPAVAAALRELGLALGGLLAGLAPLIPALVKVGAALVSGLSQAVIAIAPFLPDLTAALGELLIALIPLIPPVVDLVIALTPLIPVMTDVIKIATELAKVIVSVLVMGIKGMVDQTKTAVNQFVAGWIQLRDGVQREIDRVKSIIAWFGELPGKIGGWISAAKDAAVEKFGALVSFVKTLPDKIVSGLGNLGKLLLAAGRDLVLGLINGIKAMAGQVVEAAKGVVSDAIAAAKSLLGISSPSKVFAELGKWTMEGFVQGIRGSQEKVRATVTRTVQMVRDAFKAAPNMPDNLVDWVKKNTDQLSSLADRRESILKRIADAKAYAAQIAGTAADFASITNIDLEAGSGVGDLVGGLEERLQAMKNFANNIKQLAKMGLNKTILKQIIEAGAEKGGSLAEMLVGASGSEIKAINKAQAQIDRVSKQLGKNAADALYDSGKQAGQGFLKGLQGQLKEIEGMMAKIARAVVEAVKKELKVKSPSKVMADIGGHTMAGWIEGVAAMQGAASSTLAEVVSAAAAATTGLKIPGPVMPSVTAPSAYPLGQVSSTAPGTVAGSLGQGGVSVHMNGATIREEADLYRLGSEFAFRLHARG